MTDTRHLVHAEPARWPHPRTRLGQRQVLRVDGLVLASTPRCPQAGPLRRPAPRRRGARRGRGCFDALPRTRQPPHRHRTEPAYARRTAPQCRALRDRPRDPRGACRVDRPRQRERRRGDLHARAVHGGGPDRCARGSAPHPASWRTFRVHRTRGSGPGPLRALQRLLRRPWRYVFDGCCLDRDTAPRSRPPASPMCGSSHSDSVACSCPCGPRSVASQSHETPNHDGVGRHGRAHPGRDAFGVDPCDRRGRSRSCRAAATTSASSSAPASTGSSARPTNSRPNPRFERSWRCICCRSAIRCWWPVSSPRCPSDTPAGSHSASVSAARTRTSSRSAVSIHVPGDAAWTNP